jgi:hypothetical protein
MSWEWSAQQQKNQALESSRFIGTSHERSKSRTSRCAEFDYTLGYAIIRMMNNWQLCDVRSLPDSCSRSVRVTTSEGLYQVHAMKFWCALAPRCWGTPNLWRDICFPVSSSANTRGTLIFISGMYLAVAERRGGEATVYRRGSPQRRLAAGGGRHFATLESSASFLACSHSTTSFIHLHQVP